MIRINIICIGKIKEKYFTDAISEYAKRLTAFCKFSIVELAEEKIRNNNPNQAEISEVIEAEGEQLAHVLAGSVLERIIKKIGSGDYVVAMCIEGKQLSSEELSAMLDNAAIMGKSTVDFIIGGSYGLSNKVKSRADFKLSMSKMTFPHQMARMVLSEQIYRSFEISTNGKYHK